MPLTNLLQFTFPEASPRIPRTGFETIPPDLSKAELFRYFTYTPQDRHEIFECRGSSNKVGFALLLSGVRLTGRFPSSFEVLPASLLAHVCAQLKIEGLLLLDYPQRQATRHEHIERIKTYLGLRSFIREQHQPFVSDAVRELVRAGIPPDEIPDRTEDCCITARI